MAYLTRKLDSRSTSGARAATVLVPMGRHLEFARAAAVPRLEFTRCGGRLETQHEAQVTPKHQIQKSTKTRDCLSRLGDQTWETGFLLSSLSLAVVFLGKLVVTELFVCQHEAPHQSSGTARHARGSLQLPLAIAVLTPILQDFESDIKAVATSASDKKH